MAIATLAVTAGLGVGKVLLDIYGSYSKARAHFIETQIREEFNRAQQNIQMYAIGADSSAKKYALLKTEQITSGRQASGRAKGRIGTSGVSSRAMVSLIQEYKRRQRNIEFSAFERTAKIAVHKQSSIVASEEGLNLSNVIYTGLASGLEAVSTFTKTANQVASRNAYSKKLSQGPSTQTLIDPGPTGGTSGGFAKRGY